MKGWKSAERSIEPSVAWDQAGVILKIMDLRRE